MLNEVPASWSLHVRTETNCKLCAVRHRPNVANRIINRLPDADKQLLNILLIQFNKYTIMSFVFYNI
jgi:hypothetical protein